MVKEALLYERLKDGSVQCRLCSHLCRIRDSRYGFCGVRQNKKGILYTEVYGELVANHIDPIEKKPLYHFFPGSTAYSIATKGCNFRCGFCQNWQISQAPRENGAKLSSYKLSPDEIVRQSISHGCKSISYTYTEPTIFFEYAYDTAKIAKEQKLHNNFVTNGYMTRQALDIIGPYLDAANVDLKSFREATYKEVCGGHLEPVCESIKYMKRLGIWVEITTLIVPGINDSQEEMRDIAAFISEVGIDIPWHISRFHPDYKYTDVKPTPIEALRTAYDTGKKAGLRYVYLGNVAEDTNTYCYNCGELLILRDYLFTLKSNLKGSSCPKCGSIIDGIFI